MSTTKFLVPTDFTSVSECAVNHAVLAAKRVNAEVNLLHVVADKDDIPAAKERLNQTVETHTQSGVVLTSIVRVGNIFDDIGEVASEIGADLIYMGTHGMKGMQFITGSRALKVISSSSAPFVVVQEKEPNPNGYNNIVVPLDLSKETKQKLKLATDLAKYFDSCIHLITPDESDEFLKNQLDRNVAFAKQYLTEKGVKFNAIVGKAKDSGFASEVIKYAAKENADLITIMNLNENSLIDMIGGSYEQKLITNEAQIPVMCVNPLITTIANNVLFT